jgi:zinc-ribbon domain
LRDWRKMTWVIIVWCVLMAIWIIAGIAAAGSETDCAKEATEYLSKEACEDANDVGTGIGVIVLWFIWFFGFIALSLIWLMTRPKGRECPACGDRVKKGKTTCPNCGHDFAAAARVQHQKEPPPPSAQPPVQGTS